MSLKRYGYISFAWRLPQLDQNKIQNTTYAPFQALRHAERMQNQQASLNVKRAIVLVCKSWNILAMELLSEEIRIRHGSNGLLKSLERSRQESGADGYGRWVRRVVIDPVLDFDHFDPVEIPAILELCNSAETIIRPYSIHSVNPPLNKVQSTFPTLQSVLRIDWWLPAPGPKRYCNPVTTQFLGQVAHHSPNLRYLTLNDFFSRIHIPNRAPYIPECLDLPSLETLQLEMENERLFLTMSFHLPKLEHLILGCLVEIIQPLLAACGTQLRVVEILEPVSVGGIWEFIEPVLSHCRNLQELHMSIDVDPPLGTMSSAITHPKLECIGLRPVSIISFRAFLECHPEILSTFSLPKLNRILLNTGRYNGVFVENSLFGALKETLRSRHCHVEVA